MRNHYKTHIAIAIMLVGTFSSWAQEYRFGVELPLINYKKTSASIELQTRLQHQEYLYFYKSMATIELGYDITKHFDLSSSYRLSVKHNHLSNRGEITHEFDEGESRLTIDFSYKSKRKDLYRIKNKLRYQISDFNENDEKLYLRNKTLIDYKISPLFSPYYGIELIYRLDEKHLHSFRIHMGSTIQFSKKDIDTYFIIENGLMGQTPVKLNYILGIKLSL